MWDVRVWSRAEGVTVVSIVAESSRFPLFKLLHLIVLVGSTEEGLEGHCLVLRCPVGSRDRERRGRWLE